MRPVKLLTFYMGLLNVVYEIWGLDGGDREQLSSGMWYPVVWLKVAIGSGETLCSTSGVEERRSQRLTPKSRWISTRLEGMWPIGLIIYIQVISLLIIYIMISLVVTSKYTSNSKAVCQHWDCHCWLILLKMSCRMLSRVGWLLDNRRFNGQWCQSESPLFMSNHRQVGQPTWIERGPPLWSAVGWLATHM